MRIRVSLMNQKDAKIVETKEKLKETTEDLITNKKIMKRAIALFFRIKKLKL